MSKDIKESINQIFEDWGYGSNSDKEVCKRLICEYITSISPVLPEKEKELINDIDDLLARFEDFTHGKDGDEITQIRKRISQIPNIYGKS